MLLPALMGARMTAFENRSNVDMEIRVYIPPARPDRYQKIFRVKPGEVKTLKIRSLCCEELSQEGPIFLMVFMDGVYVVSLYPNHVEKHAKIFGYCSETGIACLKGTPARYSWFLRLKYRIFYGTAACLMHKKGGERPAEEVSYSMRMRQPGRTLLSA